MPAPVPACMCLCACACASSAVPLLRHQRRTPPARCLPPSRQAVAFPGASVLARPTLQECPTSSECPCLVFRPAPPAGAAAFTCKSAAVLDHLSGAPREVRSAHAHCAMLVCGACVRCLCTVLVRGACPRCLCAVLVRGACARCSCSAPLGCEQDLEGLGLVRLPCPSLAWLARTGRTGFWAPAACCMAQENSRVCCACAKQRGPLLAYPATLACSLPAPGPLRRWCTLR